MRLPEPGSEAPRRAALAEILGASADDVRTLFGIPTIERAVSGESWLVYEWRDLTVRIRCGGGVMGVASWTTRFARGPRTLREATGVLGLWPAAAPDAAADATGAPLLRRAVVLPGSPVPRSLTASLASGRIRSVTLYDEPPDWL